MRRRIKSPCTTKSTPFNISNCERRASQMKLVYFLGSELVSWLIYACSGQILRRWTFNQSCAPFLVQIQRIGFRSTSTPIVPVLRSCKETLAYSIHSVTVWPQLALQTSLASGHATLFAANRARRDIQTAVSFLTTRVQAPDEDDWGKLKRVLKYLKGTRYLKLILSADAMNFAIHWYIDGSHQVHEDCRGQTGSLVTFGAGAISSSSNKQKCNTKSSTETEIIALHDKLSDVIWMRYFVECQGYDIDECIIFQDNMSALSLEKNGRISSSKHTKHIKAKYFLIKDYYDAGEFDLRYCPTGRMWADVLTIPLHGQMFRDM